MRLVRDNLVRDVLHIFLGYIWNLKFITGDSEDPFYCGFIDDSGPNNLIFYSAYILEITDAENHGYKYWQCVNVVLFNEPETVLPMEQFFRLEVEFPSDCMAECSLHNYPTVMVAGTGSSKSFSCTCLPETYRFRMSDLNDKVCRLLSVLHKLDMSMGGIHFSCLLGC